MARNSLQLHRQCSADRRLSILGERPRTVDELCASVVTPDLINRAGTKLGRCRLARFGADVESQSIAADPIHSCGHVAEVVPDEGPTRAAHSYCTVRVSLRWAVCAPASRTRTANVLVPRRVAVPEMTPACDSRRPLGRAPVGMVQVSG